MSKTLTTSEALKANETKRVRAVHSGVWWDVRKMIEAFDEGLLEFTWPARWEAEEPLIEGWAVIDGDNFINAYGSESQAIHILDEYYPKARIVHMREVRR